MQVKHDYVGLEKLQTVAERVGPEMCEGYYQKALMGGSVVSEPFKVICALHETHTPGHRQRVGLKGE